MRIEGSVSMCLVLTGTICPLFPPGENNILQIMVKVVRGVRPDLNVVPWSRPQACTGFLCLMQRCWASSPDTRPSFQGEYRPNGAYVSKGWVFVCILKQ